MMALQHDRVVNNHLMTLPFLLVDAESLGCEETLGWIHSQLVLRRLRMQFLELHLTDAYGKVSEILLIGEEYGIIRITAIKLLNKATARKKSSEINVPV